MNRICVSDLSIVEVKLLEYLAILYKAYTYSTYVRMYVHVNVLSHNYKWIVAMYTMYVWV